MAAIALAPSLALWACETDVVTRTLHRDNCVVCHQPLAEDAPAGLSPPPHGGIEEAHPWHPLGCVDCHGGTPRICDGTLLAPSSPDDEPRCDGTWVYDKDLAHVDPGDAPRKLNALTAGDLDRVPDAWIRFQNPSDLRVVNTTCGRCHVDAAALTRRSAHALQTGALAIARMRAGLQPTVEPRFAATAQRDPNPRADGCTSSSVTRFSPLLIDTASTEPRTAPTPENVQEQLLVQACLGCHLQDSGPITRAPGSHRGAGCAACHVDYAEDGLSRSADPFVPDNVAPHPETHALVASPSTQTCVACHAGGARIGLSYQGLREAALADDLSRAVPVGRPLHGLAAEQLIRDEDRDNGFDETPPDLHFEAGLACVDCHGAAELHGSGRIGADRTCEPAVTRCEDCHGDVRREADLALTRHALSRRADGAIVLTTRRDGRALVVPQTRDALDPTHPRFNPLAAAAKAVDAHDWSHADRIECSTCHAGWMPSCYGCHVELDLAGTGRYLTTAAIVPGAVTTELLMSATHDQVLLWNQRGKLQGSMPAERLFFTLHVAGEPGDSPAFAMAPRSLADAAGARHPSFGQRPIDPHTTRKASPFSACDRCHATAPDRAEAPPPNEALLDLTHGFGTRRFDLSACDLAADPSCGPAAPATTYPLDAVIARDGSPLVVIGHRDVRPLGLDEIARMRAIVVEATTPIPADARTDRRFPAP